MKFQIDLKWRNMQDILNSTKKFCDPNISRIEKILVKFCPKFIALYVYTIFISYS
jgi:hypothetical protein